MSSHKRPGKGKNPQSKRVQQDPALVKSAGVSEETDNEQLHPVIPIVGNENESDSSSDEAELAEPTSPVTHHRSSANNSTRIGKPYLTHTRFKFD